MIAKTLIPLVACVAILLTGCATPIQHTAGVDMPSYFRKNDFYTKSNLDYLTTKASSGLASSQLELALVYSRYIGDGSIQKDIKLSNYWLEKSAAQNYISAVAMLAARRYQYSQFGYEKDDALAEKLSYQTYQIYLSRPKSDWDSYELYNAAGALLGIADKNLSNKELAHELLCKTLDIGSTDKNLLIVLHEDLSKIGKTCP